MLFGLLSVTYETPVLPVVLERLPATFMLAGAALGMAFVLAIIIGCLAAMHSRS